MASGRAPTGAAERLAALERRVAALERAPFAAAEVTSEPPAPPGTWWVLETLRSRAGDDTDTAPVAGSVVLGGITSTPGSGDLQWQLERPLPWLLEHDWSGVAETLAALGHPVRLAIVRALLLGARTMHDLQQIPDLGTSGQLQHHLRELRAAGVVTQPRRNDYALTPALVVPALVMITAAIGA